MQDSSVLLCVVVGHSLCSIHCVTIPWFLFCCLLYDEHLNSFQLEAITNTAAVNILSMCCLVNMYSIFAEYIPRKELWDHWIYICSVLVDAATSVSSGCTILHIHWQCVRVLPMKFFLNYNLNNFPKQKQVIHGFQKHVKYSDKEIL